MPVVKKPKKGKKVRRPKGNRVASAPTRDVIINISTGKPRASKTLKPAVPKRSEDLGGRIKDFEVSQSQFRQTQMIKEQAVKMGLLDKRLSVLTSVVDNEQTKPLVQKPPKQKKEKPPAEQEEEKQPSSEEIEEREEGQEGKPKGKPRGRPKESEEQKKANKEKRAKAREEALTNPVVGTAVVPVEAEMTGKKEPITGGGGGGGGGEPVRADLVGATPIPRDKGSKLPVADVEGVDRGAEEKPFKLMTTKKKKDKKEEDPNQTTLEQFL